MFSPAIRGSFPKLHISDTSYIVIVTRGHRDDMRVLVWR